MNYAYLTGLTTGMVCTLAVVRPSLTGIACALVCVGTSHLMTRRPVRARSRR